MTTIKVAVCGDIWLNPDEIKLELENSDIDQPIELDLRSEGPSLTALGITNLLDAHCKDTGRNPQTIKIIKFPNLAETLPYEREYQSHSHFFDMSLAYWRHPCETQDDARLFGFFVGRRTISRAAMLYHCWRDLRDYFLFSRMKTSGPPQWVQPSQGYTLENVNDWIHLGDFRPWWENCPIDSLDGYDIIDQYDVDSQTNSSILNYYDRFHIELVAETYTLGTTFFPTEKTVRPIMAAQPMIIYGPRHFLENLRAMGFCTWKDLWDESYDNFSGPDRWINMSMIISKIAKMSDKDRRELLIEAKFIAWHNRKVLSNLLGIEDESDTKTSCPIF